MRVQICPRCQKPVEALDYRPNALIIFGGLDPRFRCRKCGYRGLPILLTDEDEEKH